jgi:hypothetical protein
MVSSKAFKDKVVSVLRGQEDDAARRCEKELADNGAMRPAMNEALVQAGVRPLGSWDVRSGTLGALKRRGYVRRVDTHEMAQLTGRPLGSYVLTELGFAYVWAYAKSEAVLGSSPTPRARPSSVSGRTPKAATEMPKGWEP